MKNIIKMMLTLLLISGTLYAGTRIKNLADIKGVRSQQIVGYGIVVGLSGTGDGQGAIFTVQSIGNMLAEMGIKVDVSKLKVKNAAAVMVTGTLPPFAESGSKIDITVSSLGDAKSLQGGTLLMTPLKAPDGKVYAVAQGVLSIGGYSIGNKTKNHPTVGTITEGAVIERGIENQFVKNGKITLVLNRADFSTSFIVADAVNRYFASNVARAVDGREIEVEVKEGFSPIKMAAFLEQIEVMPDKKAVIVLNERTGTVVMGGDIIVRKTAVSHGNLSVTVDSSPFVSQPGPLSNGNTVAGEQKNFNIEEEHRNLNFIEGGKISDLVKGLNALGVSPRDLISIIQALKKAGSIDAEIEVM